MRLTLVALAALPLAAAACKKPVAPGGTVVAVVAGRAILSDELDRRVSEGSAQARARAGSVEGRREQLELIIRQELLAQEAERLGLGASPAVREQTRRAMVQEVLRVELDKDLGGATLTDAELLQYYEQHRDEFVRPERVRLLRLQLLAAPGTRATVRKKAAALLASITAAERRGELHAFENEVKRSSEDSLSRPAGGDLRFLARADLERQFGPELAAAAFALRTSGEMSGPIDTAQGVELIRLQSRLAALNRSFADAKESLRGLLVRDRRQRDYEALVRRLRAAAQITIVEDALAKARPLPEARQ